MVPPGPYLADIGLERSTQGRYYVPVDQADRFDHLCLRHRQILRAFNAGSKQLSRRSFISFHAKAPAFLRKMATKAARPNRKNAW